MNPPDNKGYYFFTIQYVTVRLMTDQDLLIVGAVHKHLVRETHKIVGLD
jgi:hypothetical protein